MKGQKPPAAAYPREVKTLGDHVRKRRLGRRLLQREIAEQLGVSTSTVEGWEQHRHQPDLRYIPRVVEFLGYVPFSEPETLAERLMLYRKLNGISRKELARRLGADEATVWRWETGQRQPQTRLRVKLEGLFATAPSSFRPVH